MDNVILDPSVNNNNNNDNSNNRTYYEIVVDMREDICVFDNVINQCVHDVQVLETCGSKPKHLGTLSAQQIIKLFKYHNKEDLIPIHFREYDN